MQNSVVYVAFTDNKIAVAVVPAILVDMMNLVSLK